MKLASFMAVDSVGLQRSADIRINSERMGAFSRLHSSSGSDKKWYSGLLGRTSSTGTDKELGTASHGFPASGPCGMPDLPQTLQEREGLEAPPLTLRGKRTACGALAKLQEGNLTTDCRLQTASSV